MSQKIGDLALSSRMSHLENKIKKRNNDKKQQQQARNVSGPDVSRNLDLQY